MSEINITDKIKLAISDNEIYWLQYIWIYVMVEIFYSTDIYCFELKLLVKPQHRVSIFMFLGFEDRYTNLKISDMTHIY